MGFSPSSLNSGLPASSPASLPPPFNTTSSVAPWYEQPPPSLASFPTTKPSLVPFIARQTQSEASPSIHTHTRTPDAELTINICAHTRVPSTSSAHVQGAADIFSMHTGHGQTPCTLSSVEDWCRRASRTVSQAGRRARVGTPTPNEYIFSRH